MEFAKENELLKDTDPEEPYRRRKDEEKTSISWGQRKLLMTLVSFIANHIPKNTDKPVILYCGAAPGVGIGIAARLFPSISWHLYDPAPFKIKTDYNRKIVVYQKKFTDEIAHYWASIQEKEGNIYFISDIRTADYTKAKDLEDNEKQIMGDMELQKKWVEIIKPCKSQLKFRLPYTLPNLPLEIEYFDGVVYKQPWVCQTSTETRLVLTSPQIIYKKYSCEKYQSQLFYHNIVVREKNKYINPFIDEPELLDDYDSCCEVSIWKDYLNYIGKEITKENVIQLSRNATKLLTQGRKYADTLSYLRSNPQAIKKRNFE
jgi:hypothetical protein